MPAIALDFALLARLAAHAQLLAFALRAALAPAAVVAALVLSGAPHLVVIVARRVLRQLGRAVGTGTLIVRSICAVRSRRIHGGRGVGSALAERELGFLSAEVSLD